MSTDGTDFPVQLTHWRGCRQCIGGFVGATHASPIGYYKSTLTLADVGMSPVCSHWSGRSFPTLTVYFPSA